MSDTRLEGTEALGDHIVEQAMRVRQLDKISPGCVTRMNVKIQGEPYEIFVRVQPRQFDGMAGR